MKSTGLKGP